MSGQATPFGDSNSSWAVGAAEAVEDEAPKEWPHVPNYQRPPVNDFAAIDAERLPGARQ